MRQGFSAREVAEIVGVPESRIRYWAQIGLVGPTFRDVENGREAPRAAYAFSDLVAARAARELTEGGISARRVREALSTLRAQLPSLDRPILHLRVLSDGDRLVVVGDQPYEPLTGQRVMEFALDELSRRVAEMGGVPVPVDPDATRRNDAPTPASGPNRAPSTSLDWFELGLVRATAGQVSAAMEAYREALALDPDLGPAHANLGALLAETGAYEEAERCFDEALVHDPGSTEVRANRAALYALRGERQSLKAM